MDLCCARYLAKKPHEILYRGAFGHGREELHGTLDELGGVVPLKVRPHLRHAVNGTVRNGVQVPFLSEVADDDAPDALALEGARKLAAALPFHGSRSNRKPLAVQTAAEGPIFGARCVCLYGVCDGRSGNNAGVAELGKSVGGGGVYPNGAAQSMELRTKLCGSLWRQAIELVVNNSYE